MTDLLTALGLMFMIEGISYALFPEGMKRVVLQVINMPLQVMRAGGLIFAIFGFLIIAVIKGF